MRQLRFLPLIVLVVMCGCISLPPPLPSEEPNETVFTGDRVELPTVFFKGRPFVELKINGQGLYRFLVDTGADGMCITPLVAREAHTPAPRYSARLTGANGGTEALPIVLLDRVEAPSFSLHGVGAYILTAETAARLGSQVDKNFGGLIGMSALQNVLLEIDYPERKVSLIWPGKDRFPVADGIPYTGTTPHLWIATPSATHPTLLVLLDTGLGGEFNLNDIASYPVRVGLIKEDGFVAGVGGLWRPLVGQLAGEIHLGPAIWRDPKIHDGRENRIGSEALAPWKLVVDQQAKKIWLLNGKLTTTTAWTGPLDPDGRPAVYGYASLPDGDGSIVKEVDPGSRAERAGLKVGDRIRRADPLADDRSPDPYRIRLHVIRGSESFEVTMSCMDPVPPPIEAAGSVP